MFSINAALLKNLDINFINTYIEEYRPDAETLHFNKDLFKFNNFFHFGSIAQALKKPECYLEDDKFTYTNYASNCKVIEHFLLNSDYELVPVYKINPTSDSIIHIRPNSGLKPFAGFTTHSFVAKSEISFRQLAPETLCIVSPFRLIKEVEIRAWFIDGRFITHGVYGFGASSLEHIELSGDLKELISILEQSGDLDYFGIGCTVDFVLDVRSNQWKIVECNGLSTSGWYTGINVINLLASLNNNLNGH
jgi:hypothetical protein